MFKEPAPQLDKLKSDTNPEIPEKNSAKELLAQMSGIRKKLKEQKGQKATDALLDMAQQGASEKKIISTAEKIADLEEAKKEAWRNLQEAGYLEYSPEGLMLIDLEKMKSGIKSDALGQLYYDKYLGGKNITRTIWLLFAGQKAISKEDYETGVREPKDLFYFPQNEEKALDIESIRKADFYLTPNDVAHQVRYNETKYGDLENLDYREVLIALLLYNQKYENAVRDPETGELIVRPQDDLERKLSSKYFVGKYGRFNDKKFKSGLSKSREFVNQVLPHLVEKGLLLPDDFEIMSTSTTAETQRVEKPIRDKGAVMFNRVHHILGSKYWKENGKFQAVMITPDLGGITTNNEDGEVELLGTFNIVKSKKSKKTKKGYDVAGVEQTNAQEFKLEDVFPAKNQENNEDYQKRLAEIPDFQYLLELSDKILIQTGIAVYELSFKEQLLMAEMAKKMGEKRFLKFAENFGKDGLRACLILETKDDANKMFLPTTDQRDSEKKFAMRLVFRKYNEIIQAVEQLSEYVKDNFSGSEDYSETALQEMQENYQMKAGEILQRMLAEVGKKNVDEIAKKLEAMRFGILSLQSFLKFAKAQGQKINLKILKNINLSKKEIGVDLGREEKEEVLDMTRENYARIFHENREAGKSVVDNLEKELFAEEGIKDQLAYTLKIEDKVIAFCKAKRLESGAMYLGSLNVHPDAKNYSLGILFLEKVISELSEKYDIQAITRADNPANKSYKKLGFQFGKTFEKNGEKYFEIFLARKSEDKKVENT